MSGGPLNPGDILHDVALDQYLLLLRTEDHQYSDGEEIVWEFWNLTLRSVSWWYKEQLEDENDFRRV